MREKGQTTPILVLTARDRVEDRVKFLDLGADDYVIKPLVAAELLARVRALIRRRYQANSSVLKVEDLTIDTAARTVFRGAKPIVLSGREYALLEYLAVNQGRFVTRSEIWQHVYDANATLESNVVDVFIAYLRKKIEAPQLPKLLHSRRGKGYFLGVSPP